MDIIYLWLKLKVHVDIHPSASRSSRWSPFLRSSHQKPTYISPLSAKCPMPRSTNSSWLVQPNSIWWGVQKFHGVCLMVPHNCWFQIGSLRDYYLFEHHNIHKRSLSASDEHHAALNSEPKVGVLSPIQSANWRLQPSKSWCSSTVDYRNCLLPKLRSGDNAGLVHRLAASETKGAPLQGGLCCWHKLAASEASCVEPVTWCGPSEILHLLWFI